MTVFIISLNCPVTLLNPFVKPEKIFPTSILFSLVCLLSLAFSLSKASCLSFSNSLSSLITCISSSILSKKSFPTWMVSVGASLSASSFLDGVGLILGALNDWEENFAGALYVLLWINLSGSTLPPLESPFSSSAQSGRDYWPTKRLRPSLTSKRSKLRTMSDRRFTGSIFADTRMSRHI